MLVFTIHEIRVQLRALKGTIDVPFIKAAVPIMIKITGTSTVCGHVLSTITDLLIVFIYFPYH